MSIQLLWEVHRIQDSFGTFARNLFVFPPSITIATACLSTARMIWTVAKRAFSLQEHSLSYAAGSIINFAIGDHIALAAQVALVVRKFLCILDSRQDLGKSYKTLTTSFSCEFPIPEKTRLKAASLRASLLFTSTKQLIVSVAKYASCLVDLTFAFCLSSITAEDAKNSMLLNITESYNELKANPAKISKEIEDHHDLVDWLLTRLHAPMNAKNISKLLTSSIKTGVFVTQHTSNSLYHAHTALQTGAFVIGTIVAPNSSITQNNEKGAYDNKSCSDTACKSQIRPYGERFFSTY
jgi:hypothetical protein